MAGGGRMVRRCWVNFQCRGVLLIWIIVGQGPIALAVVAGGVWTFISRLFFFSFLSPSVEDDPIRTEIKGPFNSKQPTNLPLLCTLRIFNHLCRSLR